MQNKSPYQDDQLLPLIAGGDERAFGQLYHSTHAGIHNAVMAYVKDPHAAREIVQVIYIKIWDRRRSLESVCCLKDYLFILARNTVFDHFRKVTVETKCLKGLLERASDEPEDSVMMGIRERECGRLLHQVIARLPSQQREAYLLANEQEMSYDEIADHMQVSRFTVKRHLELARRFVRRSVSPHLYQQALIPFFFFLSALLKSI